MSAAERIALDELEAAGAVVLRDGWPDYLIELRGRIIGVEVKGRGDVVRPHQAAMHDALRRAGLPVLIAYVDGGRIIALDDPGADYDLADVARRLDEVIRT